MLAGTGWGLSSLLKVSHILPTIATQFSNFGAVISLVAEGSGTFGAAIGAAGGAASVALPIFLAVSAALVGIVELANALEENAHKAEKQLQDLRTQIDEMEDPASEYSNLKSRVDELTESELVRLGVLQSQLDTLKEQEEVLSRQQLAKWQKGQVEDQTTYVTNYDDYGYGVTEAYTYNQAADSLKNLREEYYNLQKEKEQGAVSDTAYITRLQSIIDKNQDTTANLRALKTAYEETGDATYKLNTDQERFLRLIDAASTQIADNASKVADAFKAEQGAADGLEDAMSQIEVATYDTSTAAAQLTASLFDQNGQLTTAAQTALSVDGSMASLAQSELQAQQAAAQANYANLILEIQKVGSAAMITAGQLSQMMALAGVGGSTADMKRTYQQKYHKSAEADPEAYKLWLTSTLQKSGEANYKRKMEEYQKQLSQVSVYAGGGGGGGSSKKSAEEKAAEEAEKQAKKAQKAQEKAAKESQQAYESAAKSAEQAAQEAARAAEQAAEEAKQKILDSIQELKDASDDFWDSKTDAIEETNKELDRQKQLEEKLKALEEAKQRKILLYKNGQFQYDKDYGTIAKAQADYEETRDKIQRERELEQLQEMKDNATEIFNEMKDIVQNGGDVTQEMINNWLKNMAASGADYYDSNKKLLNEWLDWAKNALQTYGQGVVDAVNGYVSTSSLMSNGTYGSNAQGQVANDTNGARYRDDPLYWKDGEFVGFSTAWWIDRFQEQIQQGNFGDYTKSADWLGKNPGTSVFDDWNKVLEYWAKYTGKSGVEGEVTDPYALQDMLDRVEAAKIVLDKYQWIFESLDYDEYAKIAEKIKNLDVNKAYNNALIQGAMSHADDPFGWRTISPADWTTVEGKLYDILNDIASYESLTGSRDAKNEDQRGSDYKRLTIAGDLQRTAQLGGYHKANEKKFTDAWGDYYPGVEYVKFNEDKLRQFYEDNESAIKQLQEMWFEAQTETEKQAIHLEAEARRQARDYTEEILGIESSGNSDAERMANRQAGGTMEARQQQKKNAKNIESIEEVLKAVEKGQDISDEYINSAKDYLANAIKENREASDKLYSDTEKAKLDAQNEQMKTISDALTNIQESGVSIKTTDLLEGETTPWDETTLADDLDDWLRDEDFDKDAETLRAQMLANAESWWQTTDEAERKRLHEENVKLAEQIGGLTYTGSTGTWSKNATGTRNFRGGLSLVGERGPEMRILGQGDNVIPANQTANLWKWSNTTPQQMLTTLSARSGGGNTSYTFDVSRIELPNVTDAKSFVQGLKNYALQYSYKR